MFTVALTAAIGGCVGIIWLGRSHAHERSSRVRMHDWMLTEHEERLKAAASAEMYRRPHVVRASVQKGHFR